jgi:hypothetical protein
VEVIVAESAEPVVLPPMPQVTKLLKRQTTPQQQEEEAGKPKEGFIGGLFEDMSV